MLGVIEEIVEWAGPIFATAGYGIVGLGVLLERSVFLGLVVPGDVVLALGGVYAARGNLDFALVCVVAILAAVVGESIGYLLGRHYGRSIIRRIPIVRGLEGSLEEAEAYFAEHGGKTVAIGRFATAVGSFIPFTAGLARMRYARFLAFDVPAIVVWAVGIALIGFLLGENLDFVEKVLQRFGLIILGAVVAFIAFRFWRKRHRRARLEE